MDTNISAGFRLSPNQEHVWSLLDGRAGPYRTQAAVRIDGPVDPFIFKSALVAVTQRHEIFRTTFQVQPGLKVPFQVVGSEAILDWQEEDVGGLPAEMVGPTVSRIYEEFKSASIDLHNGPTILARLLKISDVLHFLIIGGSALLIDAASLQVVVQDLASTYTAQPGGGASEDPPMQYPDVVEWQHELLSGSDENAQKGKAYWDAKQFASVPAIAVGLERKDGMLAFAPAAVAVPFNGSVKHELLLAAWQVLLSRLSGRTNVVVEAAFAGREYDELKTAVGLFVRYLPVVSSFEGSFRFEEVVSEVENDLREAAEWQDYFFPNWLGARDEAIGFEYLDRGEEVRAGDVRMRIEQLYSCTERFKLKLVAISGSTGLQLELHYDRSRYSQWSITALAEQFSVLLADAVANPDKPVSELEILPAAERQQILIEWNRTERAYPAEETIVSLFEAQAAKTPERVAAVGGGEQLTYAELNRRANQLAHWLRERGVGPDVLVGLCLDRSAELMVGVLGVMKAGAAYVPLNADNPKNRLEQQLSGVDVLVTQESLVEKLPAIKTVLCLDHEGTQLAQQPDTNPAPNVRPENLVYIIYTSGSTGVPKGVQIEHRNLANYAQFIAERLELEKYPDGLQFATVSTIAADLGNTCIFPALISGGTVHLVSYELATDVTRLGRYVEQHRIDVLKIVPSHVGALLTTDDGRKVLPRRYLITGGEALTPRLLDRIAQLNATCEVINHYGPTETTVGSLTLKLSEHAGRSWETSTIPIGKPIANTRVYILDAKLQPVPIGVVGELYIGGAGVGRGYRKQPEMTAERFLHDPFASDATARMYKTGDLARYLEDGNIEFLGRGDDQVKVRGYRIELGEVEAAMAAHAAVKQAVVLAREDQETGEKKLVAYAVVHRDRPATADELRTHLKREVPDYMVPSAIVLLDKLPLNANGKIDRQALPAPEEAQQEKTYIALRTPVEEVVANIWAEVLRLKQVSADDNFFDLGGHSLLATQVVSRLRRTLGVELPLRTIFEAPTVAQLAEKIEVARRNEEGLSAPPPIRPVPRDRDLPLSFAQQRLWFLDQLQPNSAFYNVPRLLRIRGRLDVDALQKALNDLVSRHESLGTTFPAVNGEPVQRIAHNFAVALPITDLTGLTEAEREVEMMRVATEEATRPFDLSRGPLLRCLVVKLSPEDHLLVVNSHHIVSDEWTTSVLLEEIAALYESAVSGKAASLPDLPVQFADYAVWQREWLKGEVLDRQLEYWRKKMQGAPAALDLPIDHPRPAVETFRGALETAALPPELQAQVRELSRREGTTVFMTLLAAFNVLLSKYTRQDDVVVGTVILNRGQSELERLIGFFLNMLPLRTDLSGNPTFAEIMARVREACLGAYAHQDVPFENLVAELRPERTLSHNPLFQVLFTSRSAARPKLDVAGLSITTQDIQTDTAKFDLAVFVGDDPEGISTAIEYNTDLFEAETIRRMFGHFETLLGAIVRDPQRRISEVPVLTEAERQRIVVEWNQTAVDYPRDIPLHRFIEEQVEKTPEAIALVYESSEITYRELNRRANKLAHRLRKLGVGPDVLVGICAERSIEMVVGLLGTMKAGGAYVPLDPEYPVERLHTMIADANPPMLLTQSHLLGRLPHTGAQVICLDREPLENESIANPAVSVNGKNLAYAIYTSGSTGKPKGVPNMHEAIVNRLLWMQDTYKLTPNDRVLQKTPYSFDVSVWEFFWPLMCGARLIIARPGGHKDPAYLIDLIKQQHITTLHFVPSMLGAFLETSGVEACTSLRQVFASGEALSLELQRRFSERLDADLHNLYGPTEAAVDVTYWRCERDSQRSVVPIGRPVANTQIYILDANLQPVPIGVAGELHIGGRQLARGYLNRPELTAEKFIPDPFSGEPGARLYRTGDLARFLPDGTIEYLGRIDHQVKLRGFRIELGEIEALLSSHPAVEQAVAVVREDRPGDKRLVAYVVAKKTAPCTREELREHAQRTLPEYMVPGAFVFLENLPLTSSGKIDRRNLPAPDQEVLKAGETVSPRNPIEEVLAGIWKDVLHVDDVGIYDNFFELGGHSLLATQVVSRIAQSLKVTLPLRVLFEQPSIAGLACWLANASGEIAPSPIIRQARDGALPLSFAQQRLWFLSQFVESSSAYHSPEILRLRGPVDAAVLERSINEVVRRHEILRTTYWLEGDGPVQVIAPTQSIALAIQDLTDVPEGDRERKAKQVAQEETRRAFDLRRGPLLRALLIKLAHDDHLLAVTFHHIVSDGWSVNVFNRELAQIYDAFSQGKPSSLPELPLQYADFAAWQRESLRGPALEKHLEFWRSELANAPTRIDLPTDRPAAAATGFEGGRAYAAVPDDVAGGLERLSRQQGSTLFMTALAGFQTLLTKWSGQQDTVVGTILASRSRVETENMLGCFMNFLPLRAKITDGDSAADVLQRVKETVLQAYTHQDCPFEKLIDELNPDRSSGANPLYNVVFTVQELPKVAFSTGSFTAEFVQTDVEAAHMDLRVSVGHSSDGMWISCDYRRELFDAETIDELLAAYCSILAQISSQASIRIADLTLPELLQEKATAARMRELKQTIAITATFTAEPVADSLKFWLNELEARAAVQFAPYNQVFQQLLDGDSLLARNHGGLNVLLLRFEDWLTAESTEERESLHSLQNKVADLLSALTIARTHSDVPCLVCICPASGEAHANENLRQTFTGWEQELAAGTEDIPGVYLVTPAELMSLYPVAKWDNPEAYALGHVPYTEEFFSGLGTMIARRFYRIHTAAHRVLVVDSHDVLPAPGVPDEQRAGELQRFVVGQRNAGMIVCLVNAAGDESPKTYADAVLRPEHIAAVRTKSPSASEAIQSLADELDLPLEFFIFMSTDAAACADVEKGCAGALVLELPESESELRSFLQNVWAFDHLKPDEKQVLRLFADERIQLHESRERNTNGTGGQAASTEIGVAAE